MRRCGIFLLDRLRHHPLWVSARIKNIRDVNGFINDSIADFILARNYIPVALA